MSRLVAPLGGLLVLTLVLTGCEAGGPTDEPSASPPSAPAAPSTPPGRDPLPVTGLGASAPGLEIRYLDEDGNPQVLSPKDFPRR